MYYRWFNCEQTKEVLGLLISLAFTLKNAKLNS
uniref:Uncharacterized protein n=1 Tax=Anguilla anguilla TaxID=7936 RepID=A0A0E9XI54_ANGAN